MTYSIFGADLKTGEIGLASTTVSLAVGGLIPFFSKSGAIAVSQAYAQPSLGPVMVERLDAGASLEDAIEAARSSDQYFEFRQVAIITLDGGVAVHSGATCRPFTGHLHGNNCLAFGNVLSGEEVLREMVREFEKKEGESLTERLVCALEAGRDFGGQAINGNHLRERSASVLVKNYHHEKVTDLRVDMSEHAVDDLRRTKIAVDLCEPYLRIRAEDPENCPPVIDFEQSLTAPKWFITALDPTA